MSARDLLLSACLLVTAGYLAHANQSEKTPPRIPFSRFPAGVAEWTGHKAPDFDPKVMVALGVDEYVNRIYVRGDQAAQLYVGYYRSQREGSQIHSPMNCLPGAGWLPVETGVATLPAGTSSAAQNVVNRYLIQKGLDRQVVLYWYQSHGRVVASEYWSKVYLVLDSMRLNRTDAALVRVIVPVDDKREAPEAFADHAALDFAGAIAPLLGAYLPS
jgi:EpsI family protein